LFIYFTKGKSFFYSKDTGHIQGDDVRYFYRYERGDSVFIDDVEPEVIVSEKYGVSFPYEILTNKLYCDCLLQYKTSKSILTCRSLKTGGVLWQADVAELGRYENFEGKVVDGSIREVYTDGDLVVAKVISYGLAAYRMATGEFVWGHKGGNAGYYLIALYNNNFHIFSDFYYEVDAQTGKKLRQEEFAPLLKQVGFRSYWLTQPAVNEKYIAIASHYDSAILLINRADFTVAQRIDLEGCQNGIPLPNTPRFHGNRLFQLDGDGTLHVFQED
jgi:hypothetical protein